MTAISTIRFQIHPMSDDVLAAVRASGVDRSGYPVQAVACAGGEPLRCCLRDAWPGERGILFGYEPLIPASPYREMGAVFAHAKPCGGPDFTTGYPPDWRGRRQVLRAYDNRGWIHPATREHDGSDPEAVITEMLDEPGVVLIHSRNIAYGCYMFAITPTV
jgi:hypothetical protein